METVTAALIGVVLGAVLNYAFGKLARREERTEALKREVRARQAVAVEAIDELLAEVQRDLIPKLVTEPTAEAVHPAWEHFHAAWSRYASRVSDQTLAGRLDALYMVLTYSSGLLFGGPPQLPQEDSAMVVRESLREARSAIAAVLRHEDLPDGELVLDEAGLMYADDPMEELSVLIRRYSEYLELDD